LLKTLTLNSNTRPLAIPRREISTIADSCRSPAEFIAPRKIA
jgi:hypothetical protein